MACGDAALCEFAALAVVLIPGPFDPSPFPLHTQSNLVATGGYRVKEHIGDCSRYFSAIALLGDLVMQ